jgi:hypothetical protein
LCEHQFSFGIETYCFLNLTDAIDEASIRLWAMGRPRVAFDRLKVVEER